MKKPPTVTLTLTDEDLDTLIQTMIDSGWRDPVPWLDERSDYLCLECVIAAGRGVRPPDHPFTSRCIGE